MDRKPELKIFRTDDQVFVARDHAEPVAVRVVYARPVTHPGRDISLLDAKSRKELEFISDLNDCDTSVRKVLEDALAERYHIALILRIVDATINFGQRMLTVETDRGRVRFNLREPGKNVTLIGHDIMLLTDSMGNRFRIGSLSTLDPKSRKFLDSVL